MPHPRFARAAVSRRPEDWPHRSLSAFFAATVAQQPEREMIVDGDRRLTFAEMALEVDIVAAELGNLGVRAGDVVAYQLPNWWEAVTIFLATARLGAIVNPLLPIFRERELRFTLAESGARVLFVPRAWRGFDHAAAIEALRPELPELAEVVVCRDEERSRVARPLPNSVDPDSLLLLMYTSGTTAAPKGVLHTHETLGAEILSLARVHQLGPMDRTLMPSPLTHISGVIHAILTPAILGTSAVLMDRWEPGEALRLIAAERVTYMIGAPTFLQDLVQHPDAAEVDLTSLRLFSCGGAAVSPDLVRSARRRIPGCVAKRVYGSTEFPTISTTGPEDALTHGIETEGRAIEPVEVRIVLDGGAIAPTGAEGEVQARGPECFVGYADTALNADTFTADGWFRTGDLGSVDAGGYLRISGRLKEIVVRKGEKISVREIEELVALHPAVRDVAVVALPDAATGERACAVVVLETDTELTLELLTRHLSASGLAKQKHPEQLVVVDALPRTESGKIIKARLIELVWKK